MTYRKNWSDYTNDEKEAMKNKVLNADANATFTSDYAAAYLNKSTSTLQHMRCHKSDAITYIKVGRHVLYKKKHLDEYLDKCERLSTAN